MRQIRRSLTESADVKTTRSDGSKLWYEESEVETSFRHWLEQNQWKVFPRSGIRGDDICALDIRGGLWRFEVKGCPREKQWWPGKYGRDRRRADIHMRFIYALGEICTECPVAGDTNLIP